MEHELGFLGDKRVVMLIADHTRYIKIGDTEFDLNLFIELLCFEGNVTVTREQVFKMTDVKALVALILEQQFEYWYDPCGKSGHTLNSGLTRQSAWCLKRLFKIVTGNNA